MISGIVFRMVLLIVKFSNKPMRRKSCRLCRLAIAVLQTHLLSDQNWKIGLKQSNLNVKVIFCNIAERILTSDKVGSRRRCHRFWQWSRNSQKMPSFKSSNLQTQSKPTASNKSDSPNILRQLKLSSLCCVKTKLLLSRSVYKRLLNVSSKTLAILYCKTTRSNSTAVNRIR